MVNPVTTADDGVTQIAVVCCVQALRSQAQALASSLGLPCRFDVEPEAISEWPFVLLVQERQLCLQQTGRKAPGPIVVDFVSGAVAHRRLYGGGKGQQIAKAVGLKAGVYPHVWDMTAGLGRDAFVLATQGCHVTLFERSPVVAQLLQSGLLNGRLSAREQDLELWHILERMQLNPGDSREALALMGDEPRGEELLGNELQGKSQRAGARPDVIYLDPMFPERSKSAQIKKEMKAFHWLVGSDPDADQLLPLALAAARYRVVVKRPKLAPFLAGQKPSHQLLGKSGRFDIYTLKKMPDVLPLVTAE